MTINRPNWTKAACLGRNTNMWYPERGHIAAGVYALTICADCPIQPDCLNWALETGEDHGIWGGLTETERAEARNNSDQAQRALRYLEWGWSVPRIAEWMGVSTRTIQRYQHQAAAA